MGAKVSRMVSFSSIYRLFKRKNGKNHEKVEMLNARVQKIYAFLTQFFLQYDANDV